MNRSSSKPDPDQHENCQLEANAASNGLRADKDHELDESSQETRVWRDASSAIQRPESPETPPSDLSKETAGEQSPNSITTTMLYGTIAQEQTAPGKSSDLPTPDELPSSLGRYQIEALLGRGGMGSVYQAHDTQLDRKVALKVPKFETNTTSRLIDRFYREARSAANLAHPNLCPVFDVGEVDGTHYIAMALIKGATLASHINNTELPEGFAAKTVYKIARAMQEAHSSGIIHRDLKPANIMIDHRKEPIVMDFGLACRDELGDDSRLTQEGALIGSPAYMSPEQLRGTHDSIGPSSDVYSLGIVLYEILSGKLPFAGNGSIGSMISQILTEDPTELKSLRPGINDALARICAKAMAKNPDNRYASMESFANDLERFIRSQASRKKSSKSGSTKAQPNISQIQLNEQSKVVKTLYDSGQFVAAVPILQQMLENPQAKNSTTHQWASATLSKVQKRIEEDQKKQALASSTNLTPSAIDADDDLFADLPLPQTDQFVVHSPNRIKFHIRHSKLLSLLTRVATTIGLAVAIAWYWPQQPAITPSTKPSNITEGNQQSETDLSLMPSIDEASQDDAKRFENGRTNFNNTEVTESGSDGDDESRTEGAATTRRPTSGDDRFGVGPASNPSHRPGPRGEHPPGIHHFNGQPPAGERPFGGQRSPN